MHFTSKYRTEVTKFAENQKHVYLLVSSTNSDSRLITLGNRTNGENPAIVVQRTWEGKLQRGWPLPPQVHTSSHLPHVSTLLHSSSPSHITPTHHLTPHRHCTSRSFQPFHSFRQTGRRPFVRLFLLN